MDSPSPLFPATSTSAEPPMKFVSTTWHTLEEFCAQSKAAKARKVAMKALAKRHIFLATYSPQQAWSFPDSFIYYVTKNPSTSKFYEKLIQACKYFFVTNPLLIVPSLTITYCRNEWSIHFDYEFADLPNLLSKIWVTENARFDNWSGSDGHPYFSTILIPKIYQSDIKVFDLRNQNVSLDHLKFVASKCKEIYLMNVSVLDDDGINAALEDVVASFPFMNIFHYSFGDITTNIITPKTVQKLVKMPNFCNLDDFKLDGLPEISNLDSFYNYMKKNKKTKIELKFCNEVSDEYKQRLQAIVNEILQFRYHSFMPPNIYFPGIEQYSARRLTGLYYRGMRET